MINLISQEKLINVALTQKDWGKQIWNDTQEKLYRESQV